MVQGGLSRDAIPAVAQMEEEVLCCERGNDWSEWISSSSSSSLLTMHSILSQDKFIYWNSEGMVFLELPSGVVPGLLLSGLYTC